jgi:hypothetical protein
MEVISEEPVVGADSVCHVEIRERDVQNSDLENDSPSNCVL